MNSQYSILFCVSFRHAYFWNSIPDCFSVKPTAETEKFLLNHSLLFKHLHDGFMIAFESWNNGTTYTADSILAVGGSLTFTVSLRDNLFFNYTAVTTSDISTSVFYFHNHHEATPSRLHTSDYVGSENLVAVTELPHPFFTKPFGMIDIQLDKVQTKEYVIHFHEKTTYWRYLLVSDHLKEINKPAVLNGSVTFKGPVEIQLPDKRNALAFESEIPLSIQQRPTKTFQLVENYDTDSNKGKTVIKILPHPDIHMISKLNTNDTKEYSEILI